MGSSSSTHSKTRKPGKSSDSVVDSQGFPRDGSLKSISIYGDDYPEFADQQSALQLESQVRDQAEEIRQLRQTNAELQATVKRLQKTIDEFSLQIAVASPTKPNKQIPTKPNKPVAGPAIKVDTGDGERNLPKVGDHVVAMWGQSKWQYFTATIERFDETKLQYKIEWDDHDPTGNIIDYYNLAIDVVPAADQIGVGSKVLFHQATYKSSEVRGVTRSGGLRWHQGVVDRMYTNKNGVTLYDGHHTKGVADGKWVTFKGYSGRFEGYILEDFRMPPNVFDILSSIDTDNSASNEQFVDNADDNDEDRIDVFVSYAKINCPSAIAKREITEDLPPSYEEAVLSTMCDPRDIVARLKSMGVRVFTMEDDRDNSLLEVVTALKRVKVFIACLSDEYASNDRCRMEFQYAKKTLKLPVVPLVVGAGSFQWQMTVVGLLIAGELYINFKNKDVEASKMTELARAIKNNIPDLEIKDVQHAATGSALLPLYNDPGITVVGNPLISGKADFFFSYCWSNSNDALKQQQISNCIGGRWADPRLIVRKLSSSIKLQSWLDIERLESATDGLGMFGQIATAMNECKMVVACVSLEYAESDNCRMEFQFAVKSLRKPVVAIIVGSGDVWRETVIGKLVQEGLYTVDMQNVSSDVELDEKINDIKENMLRFVTEGQATESRDNEESVQETKPKFRAPVPGDHVVCLHQKWAYFLATIDSFDQTTMEYTVTWDDGDPSGRVQSYKDVALDVAPTEQVGVGSIVLFAQGSYGGTDGNNTGGARYHQGKITKVYTDEQNNTRFDGEHTKSEDDEKWVTYRGYESIFTGKTREDIRISPNAMDALMACKQAYDLTNS